MAMVTAKVPLANLFGYTSDLRSATRRHGELQHGVQPLRRGARRIGGHPEAGRRSNDWTINYRVLNRGPGPPVVVWIESC